MDGELRVSVGLEIEVGQNSIRGTVTDGSGSAHGFSGWLALLAALEELASTGRLTAGLEAAGGGGGG